VQPPTSTAKAKLRKDYTTGGQYNWNSKHTAAHAAKPLTAAKPLNSKALSNSGKAAQPQDTARLKAAKPLSSKALSNSGKAAQQQSSKRQSRSTEKHCQTAATPLNSKAQSGTAAEQHCRSYASGETLQRLL
jgi:hypothetical protein